MTERKIGVRTKTAICWVVSRKLVQGSVLGGWPQAARGTENRLERRHSSACYAAFLPGIGLSATTSAMTLAACSAAVPS